MKVAINTCYGGFGLSTEAIILLAFYKGITLYLAEPDPYSIFQEFYTKPAHARVSKKDGYFSYYNLYQDRSDPDLIRVIEELGKSANGEFSELKIVEIPDDVQYSIEDYDGIEHVAEVHRTWY